LRQAAKGKGKDRGGTAQSDLYTVIPTRGKKRGGKKGTVHKGGRLQAFAPPSISRINVSLSKGKKGIEGRLRLRSRFLERHARKKGRMDLEKKKDRVNIGLCFNASLTSGKIPLCICGSRRLRRESLHQRKRVQAPMHPPSSPAAQKEKKRNGHRLSTCFIPGRGKGKERNP